MSSQAPEVKKATGVTPVTNSSNWHYVRKVPKDLQDHPHYQGRAFAARESLGTPDLAEANRRAAVKTAELEQLWDHLRAARSLTDPANLTPEAIQAIAQALHQRIRLDDAEQRKDPQKLALVLRQWWKVAKARPRAAHHLDAQAVGLTAQELRQRLIDAPPEVEPMPFLLTPEGAQELAEWPKWLGLPPPLRDVLCMRHQQAHRMALEAFSRGPPAPFLMLAQREALALGINLGADGWLSEAAQTLRDACQSAYLRALVELAELDNGRAAPMPAPEPLKALEPARVPSTAPAQAVSPGPAKAKTTRTTGQPVDILTADPSEVFLRDVLEDWAKHGKAGRQARGEKTVGKYRKSVDRFEAFTNNPTMAQIDRPCGALFKRAMQALDGAQVVPDKTVNATLINCGTLLNHYSNKTGKIPHGLWSNLTDRVERPTGEDDRDAWTPEELQRLFGLPIWQSYELPESKNAGLDAAYWVPMLSLWTGARITELSQLVVDDLTERGGVWFLRFAVTRPGQSLKTAAARREIPLPQGLIDLGLIEYRQHMIEARQEWLFPGVTKTSQNNAGGGPSKWFSDLKTRLGFRPEVTFHSFRSYVNTELTRLGIGPEMRCKYVGHKPEGGVNVTHYNKLRPDDLRPIAAAIDHPFLNLPKVYRRPAWFPGWKTTPAPKA
jgi:integrase